MDCRKISDLILDSSHVMRKDMLDLLSAGNFTSCLEKILASRGLPSPGKLGNSDHSDQRSFDPGLFVRISGRSRRRICFINRIQDITEKKPPSIRPAALSSGMITGDRIYGPGACEYLQHIIACIHAVSLLVSTGVVPVYEVFLFYVSGKYEKKAVDILLKHDRLSEDDIIIVPGQGSKTGDLIGIKEKGKLVIKLTIEGKRSSSGSQGKRANPIRVANILCNDLDRALHRAFPDHDRSFLSPASIFEPTGKIDSSTSSGITPEREYRFIDCRILPSISIDSVLKITSDVCDRISHLTGAGVFLEMLEREDPAAATPIITDAVAYLSDAVEEVYGFRPSTGGTGNWTIASELRRRGFKPVLWGQSDGVEGSPDEYCRMEHVFSEASVFAILMSGCMK